MNLKISTKEEFIANNEKYLMKVFLLVIECTECCEEFEITETTKSGCVDLAYEKGYREIETDEYTGFCCPDCLIDLEQE